ncbi:MAG TPA: alpha/beta fold hydrolase [Blastocatellia bacterium]
MTVSDKTKSVKKRRWRRFLLIAYFALLALSHLVRALDSTIASNGDPTVTAHEVNGDERTSKTVRLSYREYRPADGKDHPAILLLHGSPGSKYDFHSLAPALAKKYRVITLDLPGFGHSTTDVSDYSIRAHADYALQLMDALRIERAHLLGFSMGGGVALNIINKSPDRVLSLTLLSAIGVQEMELLGDYHLNHALHGLQLAFLWLMRETVPHFGWLDDAMLGVPYARNFYDTDQRPLRDMLARVEQPTLIIHGNRDILVPVEAAREHHRLAPQSELVLYDDDHFMVFSRGEMLSLPVLDFLNRVDQGRAQSRATADPARIARSQMAFNPSGLPKAAGVTALVMIALIAAATLVSEDLTSIGAGLMVAQGRISYTLAAFACFFGIFVGDVLLFLAGRWLGRPALRRAPFKWVVRERDVERSSAWFTRKGLIVIAASRFVPGMRLPTYFAAGTLNTSFWWFALYFLIAGVVWTPMLVAVSAFLGGELMGSALLAGRSFFLQAVIAIILVYIAAKLAVKLSTYRGRRLLISKWKRMTRWEFWPPWIFYPPVVVYIAWLALRHRSLTVFTAANPAIPAGGFIGESKIEILHSLSGFKDHIARASLIESALEAEKRVERAQAFMAENNLSFPIVLKPNAGQRGSGVAVIKSREAMEDYLRRSQVDTIIQEHVEGLEFGVFYYRHPDEERGRIFSITEKRFPAITGDGQSTVERLILADERAVAMARFYLGKNEDRLWETPGEGERVQLVELGTHCRGAIFLDGQWVKTESLEEVIDRISRSFAGFHYGRFDIRAQSIEDFKEGKNVKVIELNGVTSEATHIYDPRNGLFDAYRVLFEQWRVAFDIGAANRRRGVRPATAKELMRLLIEYRERSGAHLS